MALGLEGLSDALNKAATQQPAAVAGAKNANDALAIGISGAVMEWLRGSVYSTVTTILIFVVVLFIFYGSFLYLTAYGDENRATLAKKTLTYAFVGLAISLLAFGMAMYARAILVSKDYTQTTNQSAPAIQEGETMNGPDPGTINLLK